MACIQMDNILHENVTVNQKNNLLFPDDDMYQTLVEIKNS